MERVFPRRAPCYSLGVMRHFRLLCALLVCLPAVCQVRWVEAKKLWILETDHTSYVIGVTTRTPSNTSRAWA